MTWTCDLTASGYVVSWARTSPLPDGALVVFRAGLDPSDMPVLFTSPAAGGSETIDLPGGDADAANASARMDVTVDGEAVETGLVLPLVPGLSRRDIAILRKLGDDHNRRARLLNAPEGALYRRYRTGGACPECTDPSSGARLTHDCASCGGSGRESGWAGPYGVHVIWTGHRASGVEGSGAGTLHEAAGLSVRLGAFPRPRAEDRLLLPGGRLYIVGQPQRTHAGVGGVPAVVEVPLKAPDPATMAALTFATWLEA